MTDVGHLAVERQQRRGSHHSRADDDEVVA
jgi:hypothetical protein